MPGTGLSLLDAWPYLRLIGSITYDGTRFREGKQLAQGHIDSKWRH